MIGAGPAGSAAAISAASRGLSVVLLESGRYPRHKVCGEFVSAESAAVLQKFGMALDDAPRIRTCRLHTSGRTVTIPLRKAGYSIPRIQLDESLWQQANSRGIDCRREEAKSVSWAGGIAEVLTSESTIWARAVINASGRWSRISSTTAGAEPWIGLKAHFQGEADDAVDLYFEPDGYCGIQAIAPGVLNACALVRQGSATKLEEVFAKDDSLRRRSGGWTQVTESFATAPVYLGLRSPVRDGVLQAGDAAGFVDPFVGDGISLALRSGVLAGRAVLELSPEEYGRLYLQAFSGIFRSTSYVRTALALPNSWRRWLIQMLRVPAIGQKVIQATRASRLDVLSPSLPLPGV